MKKFRNLRRQHFDLIFKTDSAEKEIEEMETKEEVQKALLKARKFINSDDFLAQNFDSKKFQDLKEKVLFEIEEVNRWKRAIISQHNAEEKAKLEYLSPQERKIWHQYFEMLAQKKQIEKFLEKITQPENNAINAYEEVRHGAKIKLLAILSSANSLKKSVEEIQKKLETPDCKKNIQLVTHQILQKNTYARKMLKLKSEKLDLAVDELKDAIFYQSLSDKDYYKTREVYNILRHQYFSLKNDYEKNLDLKYSYRQKIISPIRAIKMAKNIFVNGDWKKYRASLQKLQKDSEKLAKNQEVFNKREMIFKSTDWTPENHATFLLEKYSLTKEKLRLEIEIKRLNDLKLSLEKQKLELEEVCNKPESVRQIQLIAAGILRKNHKFVDKFEELNKKVKSISKQLKHTKTQIDIVELQQKSERRTTYYQVLESKYSDKRAAALIADALLREPHAAQLVARSYGNNLEMEKTWELMSDLYKDELLHQRIFCDL